jgi:Ca-activated chloride channel family protein
MLPRPVRSRMKVNRKLSGRKRLGFQGRICSAATLFVFLLFLPGCKSKNATKVQFTSHSAEKVQLVFTYGSEMQKWIDDVTADFNRGDHKIEAGKKIFVRAIPMGSGEAIDEVMQGRGQPDLISAASGVFIKLANAESRRRYGDNLIYNTKSLALSPLVVAMWKPMAEALGWGKKPIGWADILALSRTPKVWQERGYPQWGNFRFGHTQPQFSNSGLMSLVAEAYAGLGKTAGLTLADIQKPGTSDFLFGVEKSVVHYGSSTGSFAREMFAAGPQYLSAAVLYENMVIESYSQDNLPLPIVAIYPKEGTFWSDHPVGIVDRPWVTPEHREAAKIYIDYLLEKPQQQKSLTYGFRPAAVDVPLASPIDEQHGVDPGQPKTTLEVPSVPLMHEILTRWKQRRKSAELVLVMDTSGSMNDDGKIQGAREGAKQFLKLLPEDDRVSLLPFSTKFAWAGQNILIKSGRDELSRAVDSLSAHGGTALYDSIDAAYQYLTGQDQDMPADMLAIVVLTDGDDTQSNLPLSDLMGRIRYDGANHRIHIFTIAYGNDARKDILAEIAEATDAKFYEGTPENIGGVFKEISTYF